MDKKTDEEMAADIRQLYQELTRMETEMERRGYEIRHSRFVNSDRVEVRFDRKQENVL